jgi:N-acetylmuramoyl-L-alanine amidase
MAKRRLSPSQKKSRRRIRNLIWALALLLLLAAFGYFIFLVTTMDEVELKTLLNIEMTPTPTPTPSNTPTPTPTPTNTPTPTPIAGRVVVDAGHGGTDFGAECEGLFEKDLALELALMLETRLIANDYDVVMTRSKDINVSLEDRSTIINTSGADLVISIHLNSYSDDPRVYGLEILYGENMDLSKELAETLLEPVISSTGSKNRGIKYRTDLIVLRDSIIPSCIIEAGFITNTEERDELQTFLFRSRFIQGIVDGINSFENLH